MNRNNTPWASLKADTIRQYGRYSFTTLSKGIITKRTFRLVVTMRLCQIVSQANPAIKLTLPLFKLLHSFSAHNACADFAWRSNVGPGLAITHGWGLVVNLGAKIGKNVTLFHGVTLGRRDKILPNGERQIGLPTIEDEVWIGPHAVIAGDVTIGKGSRIAAGAFIIESVPPYSVVSGNPAKIIRSGCTPDVMNPS